MTSRRDANFPRAIPGAQSDRRQDQRPGHHRYEAYRGSDRRNAIRMEEVKRVLFTGIDNILSEYAQKYQEYTSFRDKSTNLAHKLRKEYEPIVKEMKDIIDKLHKDEGHLLQVERVKEIYIG